MDQHVIEATQYNFHQEVVERSHEVPVVVDFWAAWCGPCRTLGPLLERLAEEASGEWVLAKVDVDHNPALATRFGIQGIPAVRAWREGSEVAQFVGALPEQQVRSWLARLGPSPADVAVDEARAAQESGDLDAAAAHLRRALDHDPGHAEAKALLARIDIERRAGEVDEADARARLEADPLDDRAAAELADLLAAAGDISGAANVLLEVIRRGDDDRRERARLHLLTVLDTVPADDSRAMAARRSLSLALF